MLLIDLSIDKPSTIHKDAVVVKKCIGSFFKKKMCFQSNLCQCTANAPAIRLSLDKQWAFNFTSVPAQVNAKYRGDARAHAGMAPLSAVANAELLQFLRSARGIQTCTLFV